MIQNRFMHISILAFNDLSIGSNLMKFLKWYQKLCSYLEDNIQIVKVCSLIDKADIGLDIPLLPTTRGVPIAVHNHVGGRSHVHLRCRLILQGGQGTEGSVLAGTLLCLSFPHKLVIADGDLNVVHKRPWVPGPPWTERDGEREREICRVKGDGSKVHKIDVSSAKQLESEHI